MPRKARQPVNATIRVGLIGLGGVGELHLRAYRGLSGIRVVAAAELDARRRNALLDGTNIEGFADHRKMLSEAELDVACVLTPAASHEAIAADCASAGVHVLCEKPLALTVDSAERMVSRCRDAGIELCYGASYRYLPAVRQAHELVTSGAIGSIRLLKEEVLGGAGLERWQPLPPSHYPTGGPGGSGMGLMDHGIHLIDLFLWFTASRVVAVTGRGNRSGQAPRSEFLHMEFDCGASGVLVSEDASFPTDLPAEGMFADGAGWDFSGYVAAGTWSAHPGCIEIFGSAGSMRILHYANALYLFNGDGTRRIPLTGRPSTDHFATQLETFLACLRAGRRAPVTGEDGIRALSIALRAYQ